MLHRRQERVTQDALKRMMQDNSPRHQDGSAGDANYGAIGKGYANFRRPQQVEGHGEINNWTITFDLDDKQLLKTSLATFTIQLAGAKTAAGNTDVWTVGQEYNNLPFTVVVNGHELEPWIIP